MAIIGHLWIEDCEVRETDTPRYVRTASGYGRKIPTRRMVRHNGRWKRVYVCCFSNAGTAYIVSGDDWIVIR